jgi:hypothetical protein
MGQRRHNASLESFCMVEIRSMSAIGITTKVISAQSRFVNQKSRRGTTSGLLMNDRG